MTRWQSLSELSRRPLGIYLMFQVIGPLYAFVFAYLYSVSPLLTMPMSEPIPTFKEATFVFFANPFYSIGYAYMFAGIPLGLAGACFAIYQLIFKYLPLWPVIVFVCGMVYLIQNAISDHGDKAFAIAVPMFGISATSVAACWVALVFLRMERGKKGETL